MDTKPRDGEFAEKKSREVDPFTALLSILDFIDHEMPGMKSLVALKSWLVLWRKTHGFGKVSEEIGATELARRTKVNRADIKKRLRPHEPHELAGVKVEPQHEGRQQRRTVYSLPVNNRVQSQLANAKLTADAKKQNPPTPGGKSPPPPRGGNPPTQSEVQSESCTSNQEHIHTSDYPPKNQNSDSPSSSGREPWSRPPWNDADFATVERALQQYMDDDNPPDYIVRSCLEVGFEAGKTADQICELLKSLFRKYPPGKRGGPRKWGWFPAVIKERFANENAWIEAAKAPIPHLSEIAIPRNPELERGIEALELAHAERSIAESVLCRRCGDTLIRYSDGTITACKCRGRISGRAEDPFGARC